MYVCINIDLLFAIGVDGWGCRILVSLQQSPNLIVKGWHGKPVDYKRLLLYGDFGSIKP